MKADVTSPPIGEEQFDEWMFHFGFSPHGRCAIRRRHPCLDYEGRPGEHPVKTAEAALPCASLQIKWCISSSIVERAADIQPVGETLVVVFWCCGRCVVVQPNNPVGSRIALHQGMEIASKTEVRMLKCRYCWLWPLVEA
jgi:hypothetical protein